MAKNTTFLSSNEVLTNFGASSVVSEGVTELHIRDWVFKSSHDKICSSQQLSQLARHIESIISPEMTTTTTTNQSSMTSFDDDNIHINSFSMRLPPMLFLQDALSVSYIPGKIQLKVNASDALTAWAAKHSASYMKQYPLTVAQVPYAKTWLERSLPNVAKQIVIAASSATSQTNSNVVETSPPEIKTTLLPKWDWTFASDYCFSVSNNSSVSTILSGRRLADHQYSTPGTSLQYTSQSSSSSSSSSSSRSSTSGPEMTKWTCEAATQSGLDMNLLRQSGPDSPILFYDQVLLYQVSKSLFITILYYIILYYITWISSLFRT